MSHVIVCGLGQLGYRVTRILADLGERVIVITSPGSREEFIARAEGLGVKIILGDARDERLLIEAEVKTATALIACIDGDLTNIEIALDARRLAPEVRVVARLFDQSLARRLEDTLGIHRALAMSSLAAPSFASAAVGSSVYGAFSVSDTSYSVTLEEGTNTPAVRRETPRQVLAPTTRRPSVTVALRQLWTQVPAVLRYLTVGIFALGLISMLVFRFGLKLSVVDSFYFVTTTLTTTGYGDITAKDAGDWLKLYLSALMLIGSAGVAIFYSIITDFIVTARFDEMMGRQQVTSTDHVVIVGLGNVGLRTAETLRAMGHEVAIVDAEIRAENRRLLGPNVAFITGDGREAATLTRAGIQQASAVIAATNDDAINLSIGLAAKGLNPAARTVVRLFNADFAAKVEAHLDIDVALSASRIAAPGFVGAALYPDALFCFKDSEKFSAVYAEGEGFRVESHSYHKEG